MKIFRLDRRVRKAACQMEWLESRCLLSATVTAQIPTQNISAGQTSAPISLRAYFDDPTVTGTAVVLQTNLGNIPLVLTDSQTPQTVANFKQYITSGGYANTLIYQSIPGSTIQGGGYTTAGTLIPSFGTIPNEASTASLKNTTGTIAMALSGDAADPEPNSATSEWFINLNNNPGLDEANTGASDYVGGPFTAFGSVVYNGMSVVNAIANLDIVDDSAQNSAWNTLPVLSGPAGGTVTSEPATNLITVTPEILPGGLIYSAVSSDPNQVTASVDTSGNLTLTPVSDRGTAKITVTVTDMRGGTAKSTFSADISNSNPSPIVTLGADGAKACTYTDASGTVAVVTLTGGGSAALDFAGNGILQTATSKGVTVTGSALGLSGITTTGTTSRSVLTITTHGGSDAVNLGSVTTNALKSFAAKGATLSGNLTSSSTIGTLTLAGAAGGTISAVSIANINVSGSISDAIALSGTGQSFNAFKAGLITGGSWAIAGAAHSVTAGSVSNWSPNFSQILKTLTVKGDFTGSLTAGSVGTVAVGGTANNSMFHLNGAGTDLVKFTVSGAFSSSVINSAGSIGAVTAQTLVNGEIYAGVGTLSNDLVLPGSASDFAVTASIGSVKLKGTENGDSFSNSDIAATTLGTLALGTLQISNGGLPAGVVGETLKSLTATANKKFTLKSTTTSANIASILAADGVILGDLVIELL